MDRALQTSLASSLAALGPLGDRLWQALGLLLFGLLSALALVAYLRPARLERHAASRLGRSLLSEQLFVGLMLLAIGALRLPGVIQLELNYDESGSILGARTLLFDPRFWLSFENTTLGPVHTYSVVLLGWLGLDINYTTIKLLSIAVWMLSWLLLYLAFRRRYGAALARLISLPAGLVFAHLTYFDYVAYNGEHMPMLLLALSYLLYVTLETTSARGTALGFGLGFLLGVVPYAKIQAAPIAVALGVWVCARSLWRRDGRYLPCVLGALLPSAALVVDLTLTGALKDFWESYILNNLLYASEGHRGHQREHTLLGNALHYHSYLRGPADTRGFFTFGLMLGAASTLLVLWRRGLRGAFACGDLVLGWVLFGVASFAVLLPKNNWSHYLVLLVVPIAVLSAASLRALLELSQAGELPPRVAKPAWLALGFGGLFVLPPTLNVLRYGNPALQNASQTLEQGASRMPAVRLLERFVKPGQAVALWGGNMRVLVEVGARLGTRDAHIERQIDTSRQRDYYQARWLHDVLVNQPAVLVDSTPGDDFYAGQGLTTQPRLQLLLGHYALAESGAGIQVYLRRK